MEDRHINDLAKDLHNESMRLFGHWDSLPSCSDTCENCQEIMAAQNQEEEFEQCKKDKEKEMRVYIANKFDEIVWEIALAQKQRSNKQTVSFPDYLLDDYGSLPSRRYYHHVLNTYEYHLAKATYNILDLIGYYKIEYYENGMPWKGINGQMRSIMFSAIQWAQYVLNSAKVAPEVLCGYLTAIIEIAKLDDLNIWWHIQQYRRYIKER